MKNDLIESRMILGAQYDPELIEQLRPPGMSKDTQVNLSLFEVTLKRGLESKRVLCCWSGGKVDDDGELAFTLAGRAALDGLVRLPSCMDEHPGVKGRIIMRELRIGQTPLREKVISALVVAEPGDRICFFGDLAKELDGHMSPAFNLVEPIILEDNDA